jgi:putative membrane protein
MAYILICDFVVVIERPKCKEIALGSIIDVMIKSLTDHQANERTFLAWIRTAVALMAFGFLIQKFTIFVAYIQDALYKRSIRPHGSLTGAMGAGMILVGTAVVLISTMRFLSVRAKINSEDVQSFEIPFLEVSLSLILLVVGVLLVLYVGHVVY